MKNESYSVKEMNKCLKRLETESHKLKKLARGIPAVEKNINPIIAFIDILNFHLIDIRS